MTYCLNPTCSQPHNPAEALSCHACGSALLLKERYRALELLGQGGFGRTFRGQDEHFPGRPACAIKQLYCAQLPSSAIAKAQSLFAQEAVRLSELGEHPQIPTLLAYFEQDSQFYLVQEFIDGASLAVSWSPEADPEAQLWQLWRELLPVLAFIHERNIIHRDIKPENIMQRCSDGKLVLIDFGIARMLTQTALVGNATIVGTPGFMAPEQMRGKVLPASDLYSLGATCLNLLTGENPDQLFDVVSERWQWRDRLPPGVTLTPKASAILNQLIAPSLRQRAQSAQAVLRELGSVLPQALPASRPSHPPAAKGIDLEATTQAIARASEPEAAPHPPQEPAPVGDWPPLADALARQNWQAADELTGTLLCELAGRPTGSYLPNGDLLKLPCEALLLLDRLWVKHSRGRFGLSVQIQIYRECGEQYPVFCDRVGWPVHSPRRHNYLQFNRRAPRGHLPSRRWLGGISVWQHMSFLVQRYQECSDRNSPESRVSS